MGDRLLRWGWTRLARLACRRWGHCWLGMRYRDGQPRTLCIICDLEREIPRAKPQIWLPDEDVA